MKRSLKLWPLLMGLLIFQPTRLVCQQALRSATFTVPAADTVPAAVCGPAAPAAGTVTRSTRRRAVRPDNDPPFRSASLSTGYARCAPDLRPASADPDRGRARQLR